MRGKKFLHFRRMCDCKHTRTTRIRTAAQGPSRGKVNGWGAVMVGTAMREGVTPWINRLRAGYIEQRRLVTESMRHRNGTWR